MTEATRTAAPKQLTEKQQRFVEQYVIDFNATQAAIRAGFSPRTAGQIGSALLKKVEISLALATRVAVIKEHAELDAVATRRANDHIVSFDVRKLFDRDGAWIPIHQLDDATAAAIVGVEDTQHGRKVKVADKGAAIDRSYKYFGLFKADNAQVMSAATKAFAEMRALVAADPMSRQQPVLDPPEQHIHQ